MPDEILKSLPILLGSLLTILSSVLLARRQAKVEIHRFRKEVIQGSLGKLVDQRLSCYPALYTILSSLKKKVELKSVTPQDVAEASNDLAAWDSHHAVLMSRAVSQRCYLVRRGLREIIEEVGEDAKLFSTSGKLVELGRQISSLEIGLKFDLLIYETESILGAELPSTYAELHARLGSLSRKTMRR